MARDNLSDLANSVYAGGNRIITKSVVTDETTIYPGYPVIADVMPNVNIAPINVYTNATGVNPGFLGVAREVPDKDIDTAFVANQAFDIILAGSGCDVRMLVEASSSAIKAGDNMYLSKTTAGRIMPFKDIPGTIGTPTVLELLNMQQGFVGKAQADKGTDTDESWLEVKI